MTEEPNVESVCSLPINSIAITDWNPRKEFDKEKLNELATTIKENGILERLIVRPTPFKGKFELIIGERRLRAAKIAGLKEVPVEIKQMDNKQALKVMFIENIQREDLNPIEQAQAIQGILTAGTRQETLARELGRTQGWVANSIRLLDAPKVLTDLVISRKITPRHTLAMLPLTKYPVWKNFWGENKENIEKGELTVKEVEDEISETFRCSNGENILTIDDLPYNIRDYVKYMDRSKCKDCKETVYSFPATYNARKQRVCLNRPCFSDMINKAKHKFEAYLEKHPPKTERDTSSNYQKRENAKLREQQKKFRQERETIRAAVKKWADAQMKSGKIDFDFILERVAGQSWSAPFRTAMAPWVKEPRQHELNKTLAQIPKEQHLHAILRLIAEREMLDNWSSPLVRMKKVLPKAAQKYLD